MKLFEERTQHFETQIKCAGAEVTHEEVEVNILEFWQKPTLPKEKNNYTWQWDISISTDSDSDESYDEFTCYINGELHMNGEEYFIAKINTLHTYHVSKLTYKKAHEELFKSIAKESSLHAKEILYKAAKGTEYEGLIQPKEDEGELNELAEYWNKRDYISQPESPDENATRKKLSNEEMEALSQRSAELVELIDAYDEKEEHQRTEVETIEYFKLYAEWSKLNKQLWHFKLIARNLLAYTLTKIIVKLEAGLKEYPDDYYLRETYDNMKDDYQTFMNELKDEFAKN